MVHLSWPNLQSSRRAALKAIPAATRMNATLEDPSAAILLRRVVMAQDDAPGQATPKPGGGDQIGNTVSREPV